MGVKEIKLSWDTEAEWDLGSKVNVDGVSPGNLELTKQDDFTETLLHGGEVSGTGVTAIAQIGVPIGSGFNIPGLTKENALLKIDLKCTDWSKLSGASQLELTSSGGPDSEEWHFIVSAMGLNITSAYQTFYLDMSLMGTSGGELNVNDINFIRWYVVFSESETIYWRNAEIVQAYEDLGHRIGPDIDLSVIADNVAFSVITWAGIPNGGAIDIKTRYSLDGGFNFSDWEDCTSGSAIPGLSGQDVSNGVLQCGQQLYTNTGNAKGYYTPQIFSLSLKVAGQEHSINLTINASRSFNMQGTVTSSKAAPINVSREIRPIPISSGANGVMNVSREIHPVPFSRSAACALMTSAEQVQQKVLIQRDLVLGLGRQVNDLLVGTTAQLPLVSSYVQSIMETWRKITRTAGSFDQMGVPGGAWTRLDLPEGSFNKQDRAGGDWNRLGKPTDDWTKQ